MILERLTLNNFRVFRGEHSFDLNPRVKYHKKRPIILFGGLNGAGKTTTLAAVRLALYGKQSLGNNISAKEYADYLVKSIHRSKRGIKQLNTASIELAFSYASIGILKHYVVTRTWHSKGQGVKESLTLAEDGCSLADLTAEQCQGFLNELIPIGVSDLFFFDGEKIAELAEDTKGAALGDSIKKLLGLDLIETLSADLSILIRNQTKKGSTKERKQRIETLEEQLATLENQAAEELVLYEQAKPKELEAQSTIAKLEQQLSSKGGAWAATREATIKRQVALSEERKMLEANLRDTLADGFPFTLAKDFIVNTIKQLKSEAHQKQAAHVAEMVGVCLGALQDKLRTMLGAKDFSQIGAAIDGEFASLIAPQQDVTIIHDVSDRLLSQIETIVQNAFNHQGGKAALLSARLIEVNELLDRAGVQIARAPEEDQIKPLLSEIAKAHNTRTTSLKQQQSHLENRKRFLREAMGVARQLEKETAAILTVKEETRTLRHATNAKSLLNNFASEMAKRKVENLEDEFLESYHRLARKDEFNLHAAIDPVTFSVTLHRPDGVAVEKDELSAGEKQIYAISILEALARTSGRRLPVIIDTPLGRLDSVHRSRLIKQYFPNASHQVIILSTDTEVDEAFYAQLSPNISHAFKLDYLPTEGYTTATEGYFWRQKQPQSI